MVVQYFTASSIDGFIADPDHSLSWLLTRDVDRAGPMGYDAFFAAVGAMVMGASTYQWLLDHDVEDGQPMWRYEIPCWVFTHRSFAAPTGDVRFVADDVRTVLPEVIAAAGDRHVWVVGGGDLAGQFADLGALDEVWVQYAPVTLGSGAPLLPRRLELKLLDVAQNGDFACARYAVADANAVDSPG